MIRQRLYYTHHCDPLDSKFFSLLDDFNPLATGLDSFCAVSH